MDETAPPLVVVGASAGGVEALTPPAAGLPQDLKAAVCAVLHLPAGARSRLAEIISRAGPLPGARDDGVAGASAVGVGGGCVFVQSPDEARFPSMPFAAIASDNPDRVVPVAEVAAAVTTAVRQLSEETASSENGGAVMSLETGNTAPDG